MKEKIEQLVIECVKEANEEIENPALENPNLDTPVYGANGNFNSLSLVSLLADIESAVDDEFDQTIIIADERAMSMKISPFRSIRSLSAYVEKLIQEDQDA